MYYNNEWVYRNICINDSHDMQFDVFKGEHCFIIGHHIKSKDILEESAKNLILAGYTYFNIFGEQSDLWAESIISKSEHKRQIKIESSKIDRIKMVYDLAMISKLKSKSVNFVVSDDEYFTEYLLEDLQDVFSGNAKFTPYDWKKFRDGFEFTYNGKDAILSISKETIIGFLGLENRFASVDKGFRAKLFDGKSFIEIWDEISKMQK